MYKSSEMLFLRISYNSKLGISALCCQSLSFYRSWINVTSSLPHYQTHFYFPGLCVFDVVVFAAKTSPRLTSPSQVTETLRDSDKILLLGKCYGLVLVVLKPLNNLGVGVSRLSLSWQKR